MKTCLAETPVMLCFDFALFVFFFNHVPNVLVQLKGKKFSKLGGEGKGEGKGEGGRER